MSFFSFIAFDLIWRRAAMQPTASNAWPTAFAMASRNPDREVAVNCSRRCQQRLLARSRRNDDASPTALDCAERRLEQSPCRIRRQYSPMWTYSGPSSFCSHHDSGGADLEIDQVPASSDGTPEHSSTECH